MLRKTAIKDSQTMKSHHKDSLYCLGTDPEKRINTKILNNNEKSLCLFFYRRIVTWMWSINQHLAILYWIFVVVLTCLTYFSYRNAATDLVEQKLLFVGDESGKLLAFRNLVREGLLPPVLVFVQSKERAQQLFNELIYDGLNVDAIHADRTQLQVIVFY